MDVEKLSREAISKKVIEFTSEELVMPPETKIDLNTTFEDFLCKPFYSINFFCILQRLEEFFGISITDNEIKKIHRVEELVDVTEFKVLQVNAG